MIKNFFIKNTNFNEIEFELMFENLIEKTTKIIYDFKKNNYCEKIKKIHITFYCDKKSHENNIYIKYQILYYNRYNKCDMYDIKYCLIDCECDVCDIDDSSYIIIERYIDLLINCNLCERLRIENVKFIF